ncbi:hypothetical protein [Bacillus altitudinis]|uniref:hypothetical protein n=1 Tax=Bacillus altitudinis TaxID=293387 RepID=UPI002556B872|nr:hypothetical protein [Bacillus altitudinis]MCM3046918.1 hypothetical protein [Bacillus altitudinis]MEC1805099.1 hypothetical protein [Bacillus altitudinis]
MAEIEGIYFCPCCNTFRDWQHKKVSSRYCMKCQKKTNFKTKKLTLDNEFHGQFCFKCCKEILEEVEQTHL